MHPAAPRTSTEGARRRDEGDRVRFCRGARRRTTRGGRSPARGGRVDLSAVPLPPVTAWTIKFQTADGRMLNVKRNHTETSRRGRRCDGCATPPPTAPTLCRPLRRVHACRERSCCGRACPRVSRHESGRAAVGRHAHCVEASMVTTRGAVAAVIAGSRPRALFGNDLRLRSSRTRLLGPGSSLVSDRVSVSPLAHPPHFLGSSRVDAGLASNSFCKVALASVTPSLSRVRGILFHHQRAAHTILSSSLLS